MCVLDKIKKLPTGISGLDQLFYEGIQLHNNSDKNDNGIVIAIYGKKGVHKTIFGLQLMHGLAKSLYNAGFKKDLKPKFYSFNKGDDDLSNMYLDMVIAQEIEKIIRDNITVDNPHEKPWLSNTFASCLFKTDVPPQMFSSNGGPQKPCDLTSSIDKYISERIVYYNTRTKALHFKHTDTTDSTVNLLYKRKYNSVAEYYENEAFSSNQYDNADIFRDNFINITFWGSNAEKGTVYSKKTSNLRCQEVIETLDKDVHNRNDYPYVCPVVLLDGFSDICDENLRNISYTKLVDTIRKIAPVSILVFDERFDNIKCDADVIIKMRDNVDDYEEYAYLELSIVKSLFQPVAFGWHQYKKRNFGIEVFPSLHRILQKRDYLTYLSLSVQNGLFDETYDEYLNSSHIEPRSTDCCYKDFVKNKDKVVENYFADMYPHLFSKKSSHSEESEQKQNKLASHEDILKNVLFENNKSLIKNHRLSTAIIGNPNTFKRLLYTAKTFYAAKHKEHTLVLLFDKDINSMRKQMLCPSLSHNCDIKDFNIGECKRCYNYIHFFGIRMGCISAEELFFVLEQQLDLAKYAGRPIKNLIINDLQKIDYSFPFLKKTSLFLSAMVEFCRIRDISLTILCDKKASLVHELCTLTDNVICIKRANKQLKKGHLTDCSLYLERHACSTFPSEIIKYNILDITKLFRCDIQCQPCGTRNFGLRYNNVTSRIISSMKEFWRQTVNINDISKCDK